MAINVSTDVFEGPFDLLLHLVSRQKVDVGAIAVADLADQYIVHLESMRELDLEVASEFLLLAATLFEMKAAALLPKQEVLIGDELDDLSADEMRDILSARLVAYKQFKNVAAELGSRLENEGQVHPRQAGIEPEFVGLMPDYLEGLTLHTIATICAGLELRRETFLLEASHITPAPVSVEEYAHAVRSRLRSARGATFTFSELLEGNLAPRVVVVTLLAVLELYKRGYLVVDQTGPYDEITVTATERAFESESQEDTFDEYA